MLASKPMNKVSAMPQTDRQSVAQSPRQTAVTILEIIDGSQTRKKTNGSFVAVFVVGALALLAIAGIVANFVGQQPTDDLAADSGLWDPSKERMLGNKRPKAIVGVDEIYFSSGHRRKYTPAAMARDTAKRIQEELNGNGFDYETVFQIMAQFYGYRSDGHILVDTVRDGAFYNKMVTEIFGGDRGKMMKFFEDYYANKYTIKGATTNSQWNAIVDKVKDSFPKKEGVKHITYIDNLMNLIGRRNTKPDYALFEKIIRQLAARALERSEGNPELMKKYTNTWGLYIDIIESDAPKDISVKQLRWLHVLQDKTLQEDFDFLWEMKDENDSYPAVAFGMDALFWIESQVTCTAARFQN